MVVLLVSFYLTKITRMDKLTHVTKFVCCVCRTPFVIYVFLSSWVLYFPTGHTVMRRIWIRHIQLTFGYNILWKLQLNSAFFHVSNFFRILYLSSCIRAFSPLEPSSKWHLQRNLINLEMHIFCSYPIGYETHTNIVKLLWLCLHLNIAIFYIYLWHHTLPLAIFYIYYLWDLMLPLTTFNLYLLSTPYITRKLPCKGWSQQQSLWFSQSLQASLTDVTCLHSLASFFLPRVQFHFPFPLH